MFMPVRGCDRRQRRGRDQDGEHHRDLRADRPQQTRPRVRVAGTQAGRQVKLVQRRETEKQHDQRQLREQNPAVHRRKGRQRVAGQQDELSRSGENERGNDPDCLHSELLRHGRGGLTIGLDQPVERREHADPECHPHEVERDQSREHDPRVVQGVAAHGERRAHQHRADAGGRRTERRLVTRRQMSASPARRTQRLSPSGLSATMPRIAGSNAPEGDPPARKLACTGMRAAVTTAAMMAHTTASRRTARADSSSSRDRPSNTSTLPAATSEARPAPALTRIETTAIPSRSSKKGDPDGRYRCTANVNPPLTGCPSPARPRHLTE